MTPPSIHPKIFVYNFRQIFGSEPRTQAATKGANCAAAISDIGNKHDPSRIFSKYGSTAEVKYGYMSELYIRSHISNKCLDRRRIYNKLVPIGNFPFPTTNASWFRRKSTKINIARGTTELGRLSFSKNFIFDVLKTS